MDQIKGQNHRGKESNLLKIKSSEASRFPAKVGGKFADISGPYPPLKISGILGNRSNDGSVIPGAGAGVPDTRDNKLASVKHAEAGRASSDDLNDEENSTPSVSNSTRKDSKPLLWFKFKNPYHENQNAWASKGQRSKRKRGPDIGEKSSTRSDDNSSQRYEDNTMDDFLDASWILQKLGQDAKGKRVEFHHPSDKTWHRGTVEEVFEGSIVCVVLDDGKKKNLVLGKQGIRLVS